MVERIFHPTTRNVAFRTIKSVVVLGALAAATLFSGKVFREAGNEFISQFNQGVNEIRSIDVA